MWMGKKRTEKFAWFIYTFAIWDIFYYLFLKAILNWPESFLTIDILFLIPVPWVAPVLCPVINSFTMILLAVLIVNYSRTRTSAALKPVEWILLITGSVIVIAAYTEDFLRYIIHFNSTTSSPLLSNIAELTQYYIPSTFNWPLFLTGLLLHLIAIYIYFKRKRHANIVL
jgi:hypothetical protein